MKCFILFASLVSFSFCWSQSQVLSSILPSPVTYIAKGDSLLLTELSFDTNNLPSNLSVQIETLGKMYGVSNLCPINVTDSNGFVSFHPLNAAYPDSYSINVTDEGIRISYSSDASCFYAIHSLYQLINVQNDRGSISIPKCFVKDFPKYNWRGLHLDVSRHFFSVEEVKKFIDLMSLYKFNVFHWHLTDDQGWRIEIKKYPKLTEIGAWRDSTVNQHYSTFPRTYDSHRYGGFYTQEQISEIVKYAQDKYISIVPEIEMPGHARAALAAYPEYSCTGIQQEVVGLWGVFDDIFCVKDESIVFLQDVLTEIISLFPGEYIHIGGDEAPKTRWENCPKCQNVLESNHLKDEHELQSYFIKRMDSFLSAKGKKLIGWDEILEGGLSPNAAVMSWRGMEGGLEAAKQGHYVVMSPGSHCYFDHYQSKLSSEPLAIGGYTPLSKVYDFSPISPKMTPQEAGFVLGAQANLWTEYIPDFDQLTYMTYPRAIALSQVLWCAEKPLYPDFERILEEYHIPRLNGPILNTEISLSFMKPSVKIIKSNTGVSLGFEFRNSKESVVLSSPNPKIDGKWLSQGDMIQLDRPIKGTQKEKITYFSICCGDSIEITRHLGLGKDIQFISQANTQYNSGKLTLVDGQFGAKPWKGHEWIGFDTNMVIIELDLGKKTKINELEISFLQDEGSWIHTPYSIEVQSVVPKHNGIGMGVGSSLDGYVPNPEKWVLPYKVKTKLLRIQINGMQKIPIGLPGAGNKPWIFIDEILIR